MISAILAFFSSLPVVGSIVERITGTFFDAKVRITAAKIGGDVAVAREAITAEVMNNRAKVGWLNAIASSWLLSFVVVGFAFPFIFYLNKVIVWDVCLGYGTTPTLKYALLEQWGGIIISGIFITSGAAGIAQTFYNRKI